MHSITKRISVLFILIFSSHCLHHASVGGDPIGVLPLLNVAEAHSQQELPVRLIFDEASRLASEERLAKKTGDDSISPLVESYYSEAMLGHFQQSRYFFVEPGANVSVRVQTTVGSVSLAHQNPFFLLSILTLSIIPAIGASNGAISFILTDSENKTVLARYKYPVSHQYLAGILTPLASVVTPFLDRVDYSGDVRTDSIVDVVYDRFESDLRIQLATDEKLAARFFSTPAPAYAVMPVDIPGSAFEADKQEVRESLERALVRSGIQMVERARLRALLSELEYGQSGLTLDQGIRVGRHIQAQRLIFARVTKANGVPSENPDAARIAVKCVDVSSRRILWSESFDAGNRSGKQDADDRMDFLIRSMVSKLRTKGFI
ncbi:MAG: CsgG/HfaB family protein [bacterium]|nr:CsgG/HfaB family protein [bacterium]